MITSTHLTDGALQRTVLAELEATSAVDSSRIGVSVAAGSVTLGVRNPTERVVVTGAAWAASGVVAVIDLMRDRP